MKIDQLLTEHKKGVKAIKYAKKPKPLVGPEALKSKEKAAPPKPEVARHKNLSAKTSAPKKTSPMGESVEFELVEKDPRSFNDDDFYAFDPETKVIKDTWSHKSVGRRRSEYVAQQEGWKVVSGMSAKNLGLLVKKRIEKKDEIGENFNQDDYDEEDYFVIRHQTEKDKIENISSKYWDKVSTHDSIGDVKRAITKLREKHPEEKFTYTMHPRKTDDSNVSETAKLSTREKFKRSLKRAGYDPDAGAKRIEDLLAKQKKEREEREKQEQEKDMKEAKQPEAPKPRNFVAKNAKTAGAGKHKDAKKAATTVRGQKHKNKEIAEAEMGKVIDYKPGQTATIDTGPGMTTILDLKKNPTSLTKDPATGKLQLISTPKTTAQPSATTQSTVKPGDAVEIGKTTEDLLRLAGLK
jgi:hypothetical protein